MIERRCRARLEDEALQAIGIARDILPEDLEREVPAQDGVLRKVNLAHAATRDQAGNVEAPDRRVRQIFVGHQDRVSYRRMAGTVPRELRPNLAIIVGMTQDASRSRRSRSPHF